MKIAYEKRKSLYGYGFIALWLVGTVLFFIVPLIKSFTYSFRDIERNVFGGFVGLDNYKQAFLGDEVYAERLVSVLKTTAMKTPLILIFALFVAVMLNQKFKGRGFARAVFFLPVIIATGPVYNITVSAKEAAQMEGATAWEYFWKITFPYVSPMILANLIFTIIDSFTDPSNLVMDRVLTMQKDWQYGISAAMAWAYFGIVIVALGIIVAIVNRFIYYEVD